MEEKKYVVLVAEDEDDIREIMVFRLRKAGFEVKEAADGNLAFQVLATRTVDAVLCDLRMPTCDGITLLKRARGVLGLKIPFAFVSADTTQSVEDLLRLNSQAVFSKPFDFNDIANWLKNALNGLASEGVNPTGFSPFYVTVGIVDAQRALQGTKFVGRVEEVSDLQLKLSTPGCDINLGQMVFIASEGDDTPGKVAVSKKLGVFGTVRQVEMIAGSINQMRLTVQLEM